jgi:putative ABC transport system ATP-binding protein
MIKLEHLCKAYGQHILFDDFSLEIQQGDFVICNGESGAGKTTFLNMLGGIEPYDSGRIVVDGLDLSINRNIMTLFREKVGFLFQNFALVETKTVEENLSMIDKSYRSAETISSALGKVNLAGFEKRKVFTLSGGEQQRVAIARLFLKKCSIVLADEPTGSLDKKNAGIIINYIKELNAMGKTVVMVTHDEELKKIGGYTIDL